MIIITSAGYVLNELEAEVGKLPPSFLPVANKRLFEYQSAWLKSMWPEEQIYISVPFNFEISKQDIEKISNHGLSLVLVPDGLTLSESLIYALNSIGVYEGVLKMG